MRTKFYLSVLALSFCTLFCFILLRRNNHPETLPGFSAQAQTASTDWPMFQHDPLHTGYTDATFTPNLSSNCPSQISSPCMLPRWKKSYQEWPNGLSQPIVIGNLVMQANMDGKLHAYDTESGTEKWTFDTGSAIGITPAAINGRVYFGDFAGKIYALNLTDGSQAFSPIQTKGAIYSSPVAVNENGKVKVYIGSNDGNLYAFDGTTGAFLFTPFSTKGSAIFSNPAYFTGTVYFAAENMNAYAIDGTTGTLKWQKKLDGESNRGDHPIILSSTGLVLFHTVPRYAESGWGLKDRFNTYGLTGGHGTPDGSPEQDLPALLKSYETQVQQHPQTKSMFLFDAASGNEITSFNSGSTTYSMIPLNIWYSNGQNYPAVLNNRDLLFGAFGGYIQLNTSTRAFSVALNYQPVRGDEYTSIVVSGKYLYGGLYYNITRTDLTASTTQRLIGCAQESCPYLLDSPLRPYHWMGYTGDGGTYNGSYFIIGGNNHAYWSAHGWFYAF